MRRSSHLAGASSKLVDAGEVALEQRDAGAFHRDIGSGAHGDADIGRRRREQGRATAQGRRADRCSEPLGPLTICCERADQADRFCMPTSNTAEIARPTTRPLEKFGSARISCSTVDDMAIRAATPPCR